MLFLPQENSRIGYMIILYYVVFLFLTFPLHKTFGLPVISYVFAFALLTLFITNLRAGNVKQKHKVTPAKGMNTHLRKTKVARALEASVIKNILLAIGFVFVTYCFYESYYDIREIFGVDPEFLRFIAPILFLWNVISKS